MRHVSVTVDDDHLSSTDEVAKRLRDSGMDVQDISSEIGIISGAVPDDLLPRLSSVAGVASVDDAIAVQLPPPDADIQ